MRGPGFESPRRLQPSPLMGRVCNRNTVPVTDPTSQGTEEIRDTERTVHGAVTLPELHEFLPLSERERRTAAAAAAWILALQRPLAGRADRPRRL